MNPTRREPQHARKNSGATPQSATPQSATPQSATPQSATPQSATPQSATLQGATPRNTSEGSANDSRTGRIDKGRVVVDSASASKNGPSRGVKRKSNSRKSAKAKRDRLIRFSIWNAIFLAVLWLLERFVAEKTAPTTFLAYIPQHGFGLATLCLLASAVWRRDGRALSFNLAALAFFALTLMGFNIPWRALSAGMSTHAGANANPSGEISLRVMTYNILRGGRGAKGLVATVAAARPDVLCLQESDAWGGRGPIPAEQIAARLPDWHLARQGELAILSRFPIIATRAYTIRGATGVQEAVLKINGRTLSIFNTHLSVRIGADLAMHTISMKHEAALKRDAQLHNLLGATNRASAPFIVAGDFNTPPRGLIYNTLLARFNNAFHDAGWGTGYSFPSRLPLLRIDHIWTSPGVRATHCFVPDSRASDHCPLLADLRIETR